MILIFPFHESESLDGGFSLTFPTHARGLKRNHARPGTPPFLFLFSHFSSHISSSSSLNWIFCIASIQKYDSIRLHRQTQARQSSCQPPPNKSIPKLPLMRHLDHHLDGYCHCNPFHTPPHLHPDSRVSPSVRRRRLRLPRRGDPNHLGGALQPCDSGDVENRRD